MKNLSKYFSEEIELDQKLPPITKRRREKKKFLIEF